MYHQRSAAGEPSLPNYVALNSVFCTELKERCSQPVGLGKEENHSALNTLTADNMKNMQLRHSPHRKRKMPLLQ